MKAEQDKTYAAKQSIRRSTSTKKRDDIKYLSGLVPFKELTPEKQNKNFRDNAYNESNIYPSNVTGPPSAPTSSRLVPPSAPTSSRLVPPSIPTSSRVVGNGLLSDRSQYKEEHPFQPRVEPNSTQNSMNNSNKKTSVFDEENYYHDKAYRNEPPLGEDSSTSSDDDFSDDSDLDEVRMYTFLNVNILTLIYHFILYRLKDLSFQNGCNGQI